MNDQQKRARLRELLGDRKGTIAPGVTDALFARLAQDCGFRAAHLSGNALHKNFCLPDRNLLTTTQVAQRIGQISEATDIPLIVDGGSICAEPIALTRAVKLYERAGAAAIRFEDALVNEYGAAAEDLADGPQLGWRGHAVRGLAVFQEGRRWQPRSPAMAAGLTDHLWSIRELLMRIPVPTNSI